jgi:hypothetical protein
VFPTRRLIAVASLFSAVAGVSRGQMDLGRVIPTGQPIRVVAFGDFGSGKQDQKDVAAAIGRRHAAEPFHLGLTTGDNFYRCGVRGVHDKKWQTRWEDLYTPLGIRFYASLGNHDYGHPFAICPLHQASPQAQVERTQLSESWRMPARYYTFAAGPARFFAIDTEGWTKAQLEWVESAIARSAGEPGVRWRIVYGHHPMFSSGFHANERRIGRLRRELLPVLQAAGVDLYVAGHDHGMEHLKLDGMDFLIVGGGGAKLRPPHRLRKESVFTATRHGFLDFHIDENRLSAQFFDDELHPLEVTPMLRTRR